VSELEGRNQQRPTKDGVHLGGSRGGSSRQTRMASECGPMCPVGYGMNQGQGICDLSNDVISSDLEWPLTPGFKVMILCDNGAFVQLQILHLLNLQCNAPLSRSPSAIAEYLVYNIYSNRSYDELDQAHIRQTSHPTYCKAVWICTLTRSFCFPPGRLTMLMWSCIKSWPVSVLAFAHIKLHRKW